MEEINHEIGLTRILRGSAGPGSDIVEVEKEKQPDEHAEDV